MRMLQHPEANLSHSFGSTSPNVGGIGVCISLVGAGGSLEHVGKTMSSSWKSLTRTITPTAGLAGRGPRQHGPVWVT
eukprot:8953290-Karenia_brevis.AAC.1